MRRLNRQSVPDQVVRPVKVLQFGEGNFLRAFADWIIDILNEETDFNGSVQVVQPLPNGMGEQLNAQDGLYHLVLHGIQQGKEVRNIRLIKSIREVINPFLDLPAYLRAGENPDLKFVISNTTEAGITFSQNDNKPDELCGTFPGKLTTLLFHRYRYFAGAADKGLVFLPCELIEKNAQELKKCILQYAAHWNLPSGFAEWIEQHNVFCNTLVDRIVPGFPKDNIHEIQNEIGFDDNMVVKAEPFHLWVIEGPQSIDKIFPVSKTGLQVKLVDDLTPYRTRKVRILNGAHTAMVPVAYRKGLRTVQETVEHPVVGKFVSELIFEEIIPTLDLPAKELDQFASDVLERFQNPSIRHELISISLNSISKFKVRVLPSLLEYQKRKSALPARLVHSLAELILFYRGEVNGEKIPLNDSPEILQFFSTTWLKNPDEVVNAVLGNESFWGQDLRHVHGLTEAVTEVIRKSLLEKISQP